MSVHLKVPDGAVERIAARVGVPPEMIAGYAVESSGDGSDVATLKVDLQLRMPQAEALTVLFGPEQVEVKPDGTLRIMVEEPE